MIILPIEFYTQVFTFLIISRGTKYHFINWLTLLPQPHTEGVCEDYNTNQEKQKGLYQ